MAKNTYWDKLKSQKPTPAVYFVDQF